MPKFKTILEEHLEGINSKAMEQYPDVLKEMIRGRSGVYALYEGSDLYYVGLASNMMARLKHHVRDRHKGLWDRFSVYLTKRPEQEHIRELEALLLRILRPKGNRVGGRLRAAKNLHPSLARAMSRLDAERRAGLLGGRSALALQKRRAKAATVRKKNEPRFARGKRREFPAAGLTTRRLPLRRTYKGVTHEATLRRDGQVRLKNILYPTLTAAAKTIVSGRVNGWTFWRTRRDGAWVRIKELRE